MPSPEPDFIHRDAEFGELLRIVASDVGVQEALVEKDYYVTHAMWALEAAGFRVYLKGGTSLSKGYGLIQRFSEDLDLKLEHTDLPPVRSWKTQSTSAIADREKHFEALHRLMVLPDMTIERYERDQAWRWATFDARYAPTTDDVLPDIMRPFVQLEVGHARVQPFERKSSSSWVHEFLAIQSRSPDFRDNRPGEVLFVSPTVTLLEKLEAIGRRYSAEDFDPAGFIRHYEDVRRILESGTYADDAAGLAREMLEAGDIRQVPLESDSAFNPGSNEARGKLLKSASENIGAMFWGERASLENCCDSIRSFLVDLHDQMGSSR